MNNNFLDKSGGTFTMMAGGRIKVDIGDTAFPLLMTNYSYKIMDLPAGQAFTLGSDFIDFVGGETYDFENVSLSGNADGLIFLNFTPTPEPMALLAISALVFGTLRRRRSE